MAPYFGDKEFKTAKNKRIDKGLESKCIIKRKKAEILFVIWEKIEFRPKSIK